MNRSSDGPAILKVRVTPRSSRRGVAGRREDEILIRLTSAPVDDAANAELVRFIAEALRIPRQHVAIVAGAHARSKHVAVTGIDAASALARLMAGHEEGRRSS